MWSKIGCRHDNEQVVVAIQASIPPGSRAEKVDSLGLVSLDEPAHDFSQASILPQPPHNCLIVHILEGPL